MEFDALYDIHTVRMSIVEPRLSNVSTFEMNADELVLWADREVRPRAQLAFEGKGEFCAGEHCRFCKARHVCRARSDYFMQLAARDFKSPDLLTDEEVAEILTIAENLENWVADLKAYATQQAMEGKQWTGFKLVAGKSNRKYSSETDVIRAATEAGFTDIYKTSLLGVGDLERRMGRKKFAEIVGPYVFKPEGAPTLVPESDPRKPLTLSAADDFKE